MTLGVHLGGILEVRGTLGASENLHKGGAKIEQKSRKGDLGAAPVAKIIFGVTCGTHGAHVSVFLRSAFFTLFTQASGTAFLRFCAGFGCHSEAVSRVFWAGMESVIFDDTIAYNAILSVQRKGNLTLGTVFLEVL